MIRLSLLLLATASSTGCYRDCSRHLPGDLVIGTGESSYEPLDAEDPTYSLVNGPQGGWHVLIGLEAWGLDATGLVTANVEGRIDDQVLARADAAWITLTCAPSPSSNESTLQCSNTFLIFDDIAIDRDPCPLDGAELQVQATVTDVRGTSVSSSTRATIADPQHDAVCGE